VPSALEKVSGDAQNGAVTQSVPDSLVVRVRDQSGNALSGVAVSWVILTGGGTASAAAPTNSAGRAAISWTLGPAAGENTVEARVGTLGPARFTATGVLPGSGIIAFEAMPGQFNQPRETDLYVMSPDGRNVRRIVEHPADDGEPAWSPDRSKLAFKTNRDGNYEIYVVNADGTGLTRLTTDPANDNEPRWSPDGARIAFRRVTGVVNSEIWVMDADGTDAAQLTPLGPGHDQAPNWSPDGSRIAFGTERFGDLEVAVINADGTGLTRLTNQPGLDGDPVWSPDGTTIAFSTERWGSSDLALMRPDGSDVRQVTAHPEAEFYPSWSPDGSKLGFTCWRLRGGEIYSEVCSVNVDGTGELRLTPTFSWASHLAWFR
jgi:Tol biopolymer transport system component